MKCIFRSTLILCPLEEKEDSIKEKEAKTTCESCKRQAAKAKKSKSSSKTVSPSSPTRRVGLSPAHVLSDTMYTNVANLQQTMLLQQQLFRQALAQNPEMSNTRPTTSFTSPSLSQYQFVSGSQVKIIVQSTVWVEAENSYYYYYFFRVIRQPTKIRMLKQKWNGK